METVRAEYETLKQHQECISGMIAELDVKLAGYREKLDACDGRPVTERAYLSATEHCQKRLDALKALFALADRELLHYLEILK